MVYLGYSMITFTRRLSCGLYENRRVWPKPSAVEPRAGDAEVVHQVVHDVLCTLLRDLHGLLGVACRLPV